jgi:UDP-glucose 4-epimerase
MDENTQTRTVLLTGAAGYIGSHTCVELARSGWRTVILDNLSNSSAAVVDRMARICGHEIPFVRADVRDGTALREVFRRWRFDAVVHFAGLKSVNESVTDPIRYYDNNVAGTLRLVEAMADAGVKRMVFSSSATVYGVPRRLPIAEDAALAPVNPYGQSKLMVERVLADVALADPAWRVALLRYFNPAGAHGSGLIGEAPGGMPNNLMPIVSQVAVGRLPELQVYGSDYDTPDGTGVRDYIHVMDLAAGHAAALERVLAPEFPAALAINLGTGRGYSVLEVVRAFEKASGRSVRLRMAPRRAGDVASCYADASRAFEVLGWKAGRSLAAMCEDAWRWQQGNPNGYD